MLCPAELRRQRSKRSIIPLSRQPFLPVFATGPESMAASVRIARPVADQTQVPTIRDSGFRPLPIVAIRTLFAGHFSTARRGEGARWR